LCDQASAIAQRVTLTVAFHHSTNESAQRVWQAEHQIMILHSQNKSKFTPYRYNVG